jgi:hypothetical protein
MNWPFDSHFSCETFVGAKIFYDFGDVKTNFKNQIEEEFEY